MLFTGNGLRVKRTCTRSADTVCEPLKGFYCIEQNKDSCTFAMGHSQCNPGQYIKQTGGSIIVFITYQNGHKVKKQLPLLNMLTQTHGSNSFNTRLLLRQSLS